MGKDEIARILQNYLYLSSHKYVQDKNVSLFSYKAGFSPFDITYALLEFEKEYGADLQGVVDTVDNYSLNQLCQALEHSMKEVIK
ncbi:hypothetical protein D1841_14965 [Neglecta sp. X4]|uniref:hypothetical protein n=1 Tax=unclassified Neglectibacter TaxID=2632164 RepID=UPI00136A08FE|nr:MULTISPECIES: hypothetical protein [unclassified Neglectibacter]NBI18894.1 hypothetical protein [Neglectibacter sp. 59]NBJ74513.1 hypothetical protein [Neglectibacter sp. X4]NCE82346.1 hypothetical protein [Neglectibacter sp. X58]